MGPVCLSSALQSHGVENFYYLAHRESVASILKHGILSYNAVIKSRIQHQSIANEHVQERREARVVFGRPIHDYVPLYLVRRNPMLLAVSGTISTEDYVYFRVSLEAADKFGTVFSDGNAASEATRFFREISLVSRIPWDVVCSWHWTQFSDGKRQRCSEVLIPSVVEPKFILDVRCSKAVPVAPECQRFVIVNPSFLCHRTKRPC